MNNHINGISTPPKRKRTVLIIDAQQTENQDGKNHKLASFIISNNSVIRDFKILFSIRYAIFF